MEMYIFKSEFRHAKNFFFSGWSGIFFEREKQKFEYLQRLHHFGICFNKEFLCFYARVREIPIPPSSDFVFNIFLLLLLLSYVKKKK